MKKVTGLFFGSFNPVHIGHMIIANYMATQTDLQEIWMVVSPQNPFKSKHSLANNYDRLHMVQAAIGENEKIRASNIEFDLPQPSYTIDTLTYLKEKYPNRQFALIMGGDNLAGLKKWKNYEILLRDYHIYVYQRPGYELGDLQDHDSVTVLETVPLMHISASYIRKCISESISVEYLVPDRVLKSLEDSGLYR
jgi:nicotinate-nucleotide adenylyltransferase